MRVLVCGGRSYDDFGLVFEVLTKLNPSAVIQGGAPGADTLAKAWAEKRASGHVESVTYPADWDSFGKSAGPKRNQIMVDDSRADLVLAFPGGRGTEDLVRRAKAKGIPVLRVDA